MTASESSPAAEREGDALDAASVISLSLSIAPQINFACQQNAVPVIREIELFNPAGQDCRDLTLEMRASPAFLADKRWHVDRLPAGGTLHINDRDTRLDGDYLLRLQESQQGELIFRLLDGQGRLLVEQHQPVEVLARNEWGGYGSSPELLAAFCMPNEAAVESLLRAASDLLRKHGLDGTLHPYEKADARRVWQQVSAVWSTLLAQRLDYAYPPSSFERTGQKVRTPDAILESRRATCLDSTLLLAALFEQMHLHPLVVLEQGHAYVGVWLKPDGFARPYTEDLLVLRKRVQLKELLVIETTLLCQQVSFKAAIKHAEDSLLADDGRFIGVLDIARARDERIRPLSFVEKVARGPREPGDEQKIAGPGIDDPDTGDLPSTEPGPPVDSGPGGRLGQWQRKLLDLSLRNPLLSMRASRTNIPLIAPDPGLLEDLLAQGKAFSIEPAPDHGSRDQALHAQRTGGRLDEEIALAALRRGKVYVQAEQGQLEAALIELYRKARNDLEEGGANTLFLAVGILHWQRPSAEERTYRAPLILIPVTISRQSVRSGIKLSLSDDESRFNTTLLEMLRQDFALDIQGLDGPLPTDEKGTDINGILTRMKQEVRDVAGFQVRDEVCLGTFSFAKYLMWKDLVDRTDKLKDNPVVRHLIETPREPFKEVSEFVDPGRLDALVDPQTLFTPLSADSSQLAAVVAAASGKNFVMIGPPGTGKSQTIANMIAHNLGLGRTVLFVSEKAAALDVVYRRLREQGLGEFCLELHSNKARKLDVLKQLGDAWEVKGKLSEQDWQERARRLRVLRDDLNQFVMALHEQHRNGLSARQALELAAGNCDVPMIALSWPDVNQHDKAAYERLLEVGDNIDLNAAEIGDIANHPLGLLHTPDWSMGWQQAVLAQAIDLSAKAEVWQRAIQALVERLQLRSDPPWSERLSALSGLVQALCDSAGKDLAFAFLPTANAIVAAVSKADELKRRFDAEMRRLSCAYDRDSLLRMDLRPAEQLWQKARRAWWLPRLFHTFMCRSLLKRQAGASGKPQAGNDLPVLASLQSLSEELQKLGPLLEKVPGWRQLDSDTVTMMSLADVAGRLRAGTAALARDADELASLRSVLRKLVVEANELLASDAALGVQLQDYQRLEAAFKHSLSAFSGLAGQPPDAFLSAPSALDGLVAVGRQLQAAQHKLHAWCAWRRARAHAVDLGLHAIVQALEDGHLPTGAVRRAIEVNHARWWLARVIDASPVLRQFVSVEHERKIFNFRDLDEQVRRITAEYIRSRVRAGLVEKEDVKRASEFGLIRRELEKKARHKPLRQLISEAPNAIPKLTPCLLMSPLSIAQYLPVEQQSFDMVIFDEASQITVWDAIGAIARGRQTIVVGDPRQLPPTSFFSSGQGAEDDGEQEEDLESILDEMLGANMPTINLSWHYRSRHESLITFSNHRYYKGGLVTFPSPVTQDAAVSLQFVGGIYERGGSQTNRAEADAIVAEIERRLLDANASSQTLGVVTFNQKQQALILDLLDAARRRNGELDRFFAEDLIEPVFVKNLESVQGDERDVILFSTTFGPDASGARLSMNFGPLNKSGGERRLNVAITRARAELKVFSSLRAEQIDLSRTAAIGVRDLKHFLEFAEKGVRALSEAVFGSQGDFESPLEAAVARDLRDKGWILHPQVGVSRFRVDLGVVDPAAPGRYLAGIECDGATYHRSATARDRDLVRESVLRGLGWRILRLWSTDYWLDPEGSINKLDQSLRALVGPEKIQ